MNREDIIRMARESECSETWGADAFQFTIEELERFAELVAAAERKKHKHGKWVDLTSAERGRIIISLPKDASPHHLIKNAQKLLKEKNT